jgi:hypothetical protein
MKRFLFTSLTALTVIHGDLLPVAQAKVGLGASSANYLGQGGANRLENYSSIDLTADLNSRSDSFDTRAVVQSQISLNDSDFRFVELPELWISNARKNSPNFRITLGRKLEEWSKLDSEWGLGIWQPRFRWDYLSPQSVGLTGLHTAFRFKNVQTALMVSPLFIPDRGAPLDFAGGRIRSMSPWTLNPPYLANVFGRETEIRYSAEIPKTQDVIQQWNLSAKVRVGGNDGFWVSSAYAYKPMNQLLMSYKGLLRNLPNDSYVEATLYPRVAYHHLAATDVGLSTDRWETWVSMLADLPNDSPVRGNLITSQVVSNAYVLSPSASYWFNGRKVKGSGKMTLSYIKKFGKTAPDVGENEDGTSQFDSRYPFEDAIVFSVKSPQISKFTADLKFLYDAKNPGTIITTLLQYEPVRSWSLYVSSDVLTSWTDEGSSDFIQRYRANDRFMGGVTYVF